MKILVTNDDGISSPGLWAAVEALRPLGELFVVAPDREQSGVGASLTLHMPIRASQIAPLVSGHCDGVHAFSVEGTPGDCCVLALEHLVGEVDLVVSGINKGSNLASDVILSGTVGATLHSYLRGYPSIAISVAALKNTRFDVASPLLAVLANELEQAGLDWPFLINVNVPNDPPDAIAGIEITRLGRKSWTETVREEEDSRRKYYWISRNRAIGEEEPVGTDVCSVENHKISITPLDFDLTRSDQIHTLSMVLKDVYDRLLRKQDEL